jgi:16S rRNA (cytosine1407-C5)-methyltransferase
MQQHFEQYKAFTDLEALRAFSAKPLRKSARVNTLKFSVPQFEAWAKEREWQIGGVPWCGEGFFVDRENREQALGKDFLHLMGGFYMQEAASMLPVALLDPKPDEKILDMSAAPGSKTTQIGARMQGRGVLIANDVQEKRIWSLITNLQRCGVLNAAVTRKVGQWFAGNMTEGFDRVLCDAPCTAEGTVRKDSDALRYSSADNVGKMAKLQRELLEAAVHACKVGGRIVYSTCTLTPEENEDVVLSILGKFPDQLRVVPPSDILPFDFGKALEDSARVQASLGRKDALPMIRLWPQTYDTEGFFSVALEKTAPTRDRQTKKELVPHKWSLLPNSRRKAVADRVADWFGTSFLREDELLFEIKEQLFVLPEAYLHFFLPVNPYMGGLPYGKNTSHGLVRISHEMATLRGHEATAQMLKVSHDDMQSLLKGANIPAAPAGMDDGDVMLSVETKTLGRNAVFGRGMLKNGTVLNRLPRDIVRMFS